MTVGEYMAKSGIPVYLKGHEATRRAIELCMENPDIRFCSVYEIVGEECGITPFAAERRIRFSVQEGFRSMDKELRKIIFLDKEKVKNVEYIKAVAYAIRSNLI